MKCKYNRERLKIPPRSCLKRPSEDAPIPFKLTISVSDTGPKLVTNMLVLISVTFSVGRGEMKESERGEKQPGPADVYAQLTRNKAEPGGSVETEAAVCMSGRVKIN